MFILIVRFHIFIAMYCYSWSVITVDSCHGHITTPKPRYSKNTQFHINFVKFSLKQLMIIDELNWTDPAVWPSVTGYRIISYRIWSLCCQYLNRITFLSNVTDETVLVNVHVTFYLDTCPTVIVLRFSKIRISVKLSNFVSVSLFEHIW